MLKIIICDNDKTWQEKLRQQINCIMFEQIDVSFQCYEDGLDLVKIVEMEKNLDANLIFMDIEFPKSDGICIAQTLRKHGVKADLIFVAQHTEYAVQGYEVGAFDFLVKPISEKRIESVLNRYFKERFIDGKYLLLNKRMRREWIPIEEVKYFLSDKRKIKAVMREPYSMTEFYMKLEDLEAKVGSFGFIRCHQSYLVNVYQIRYWDANGIVLNEDEKIPVSRKYRAVLNGKLEQMSIT